MGTEQLRRGVAAVLSAAVIAILGVGAIAPETAQAAGVVVGQRAWGAGTTGALREDDDA